MFRKIKHAHIVLTETYLRNTIERGRHSHLCIGVCPAQAFRLAIPHLQGISVRFAHHTESFCEDDVRSIEIAGCCRLSLNRGPFHFHFGIQLVGGGVDYGVHARKHALRAVGVLHHGRRLVARAVGGSRHGTVRLQVGGEVDGGVAEQAHLDGTGVHHLHCRGTAGCGDHRDNLCICEGFEQLGLEQGGCKLGDHHRGAEATGVHLDVIQEGHELDAIHIGKYLVSVQNHLLRHKLLGSLALLQIQVHARHVHGLRIGQALISVKHIRDLHIIQCQPVLHGALEDPLRTGECDGLGLRVAQVVAHGGEGVVCGGVSTLE